MGELYRRGLLRGAPHAKVPSAKSIDEHFPAAFAATWKEWPLYGRDAGVSSFDWWRAVGSRAVASSALSGDKGAFEAGFAEVYALFQTAEAYTLYPDVRPFLEWVRGRPGVQVCVLSNTAESYRDSILPALGLADLIDFGVYARVDGVMKPDKEAFRLVAERAGVEMDEVLHVGNEEAQDAIGATSAGCRAILLDRDGQARPAAGVLKARSLADVRQWLEMRQALAGPAGG